MILADKIINERKKLGWSQEELADKLEVSRQAVSKWESAQSTPDLNRILKMAEVFGVSTDYLLKDELEEVPATSTAVIEQDTYIVKENAKSVSLEDATTYLATVQKSAPRIAFGVSMCIFSPVILLLLIGLASRGYISENVAAAIGVTVLLVIIAIAACIFIINGKILEKFSFYDDTLIDTAYGVDGMVKEKMSRFEGKHSLFISIGAILCILCVIPLICVSIFCEGNGALVLLMVAALLTTVAFAVNLMVRAGMVMDSYKKVLQEGDYNLEGKKANRLTGKIAGIYWPIAVAIYLGWSFLTGKWEITWLVWPVAGVLFGAVTGIVRTFMKD